MNNELEVKITLKNADEVIDKLSKIKELLKEIANINIQIEVK